MRKQPLKRKEETRLVEILIVMENEKKMGEESKEERLLIRKHKK